MRWRLLASLAVVCTLVLISSIYLTASSAIPLTVGEMVRESESILVETVIGVTPMRVGPGIQSDVVIEIDDAILQTGAASRAVTLRFWGGTIGRRTHELAGVPVPRGCRALLLPGAARIEPVPTVGMHQVF